MSARRSHGSLGDLISTLVFSGMALLAFLTGFTGSAGLFILTADRAILFVDGRCFRLHVTGCDHRLHPAAGRPVTFW